MWALSYYLTQLSLGPRAVASGLPESWRRGVGGAHPTEGDLGNPRSSCQQNSRQLETRCGREGHTRPRGPSEKPRWSGPQDLWLNIRRTIKTQPDGHNSGVKIWSLCSVSSILSHANLAIKWEVNIIEKKSSGVFLPASILLASLSLRLFNYCVVVML